MTPEPGFFELVYEVVKLIPSGRVSSYGAIARYLGSKGSARMVVEERGLAISNNPAKVNAPLSISTSKPI